MKNVLIPLTLVLSLFGDGAAPAGDDGIGEVLTACIHRYDRLEPADAIGPVSLRRTRHGGRLRLTRSIVVCQAVTPRFQESLASFGSKKTAYR